MSATAGHTASGPSCDIDPFGEEFLTDPFPFLAQIRGAGSAVYLPRYGVWAVAGYRNVQAVLRDHERFCSAPGVGLANLATDPYGWRPPSLLLETDPPPHAVYRALVVGTMTPRALQAFQDLFEAEADRVVTTLVRRKRFDAVTDLAEIFPTVVFPHALGIQGDTRQQLLAYGALSFNAIGPRNRLLQESVAAAAGALDWIAGQCRRAALRPGTIGAALYQAAEAADLPEDDTAQLVRSLLSAGVDTTVSALSFALRNFALCPGQWALVRADPSLARNAFEETVRLESPVIGFFRTTTTETVIGQARIPAGRKVLVFYAGANRDPARWEHPARFDIRRKTAGHLGYGTGPHVCAGMTIARMEGEALIRALARQAASIELDGDPRLRLNNSLRGLQSVPIRVTAA